MDKKSTTYIYLFLGEKTNHLDIVEVSLSSSEAEYIALNPLAYQRIWLPRLIEKLIHEKMMPIKLLVDNQSAI